MIKTRTLKKEIVKKTHLGQWGLQKIFSIIRRVSYGPSIRLWIALNLIDTHPY